MSEHQTIPGTPSEQHAIRIKEIELMREEQLERVTYPRQLEELAEAYWISVLALNSKRRNMR
jgi:hypothetical protein